MKKKSTDALEPKVYLPSKSHPDYWTEQYKYMFRQQATRFKLPGPRLFTPGQFARSYMKALEGAKISSNEKDRYIGLAVRLFGEHWLELTVSIDPIRFSDEAERLAAAALRALGTLTHRALDGDFHERKTAKARLEKIIRDMLPDTRGKKANTANPFSVKVFYWSELFRLYHIRKTLQSEQRNMSQKVKLASTNFEMPIEQIRDLWKLDGDDLPSGRPIPLKEMARILTARHFKLTQHRVSNILALASKL
jgi:hypothetical protein